MRLSYTCGCTKTSLDVDDREFNDLSLEERKSLCHKLLDTINENGDWLLQDIFCSYLEAFGDEAFKPYQCGQCGDWVEGYQTEIND